MNFGLDIMKNKILLQTQVCSVLTSFIIITVELEILYNLIFEF